VFDAIIDIRYPSYCGDVLACKNLFRQHVLAKFSSRACFFLSTAVIDGQVLGFETCLDSLVQNSSEFDYANDVNALGKEIETKEFRSSKIVEKPVIFFS
jgi:hypothetical protein